MPVAPLRAPLLLLPLLALLLHAPTPAGAEAPAGIFPFPRHEFRLANGLAVVVIPCPAEGLVMDALIVDVGMRAERKPDEVEYTHLLEHLMFRGSVTHSAAAARDLVTRFGAYEQGFTADDFTCYHRIYPSEALAPMAELLAGKFRGLAFTDEEYRAECGAVLGEYTGHSDTPDSRVRVALRRAAYTVHPYGAASPDEHLATLRAMPENRAGVMAFYERFYKPNNMRLVLCGAVEPGTARAVVTAAFGPLAPGEPVPPAPAEPPAAGEVRVEETGPTGAPPRLAVSWRIPAYDPDAPDVAALALLAQMHFSDGSPLHTLLVAERGLVSGIDWPRHLFARDPSLFTVVLKGRDVESLRAAERLLLDHVAGLRTARPTRKAVEAEKRKARYRLLAGLDSLDRILFGFCRGYFQKPEADALDRFHATLARLAPDDLRGAARRIFRDKGRVVVLLRPPDPPAHEAPAAGEGSR